MAGPDARVLSYHDVLLRQADVDLLLGPEWLNDQVQHQISAVHTGTEGQEFCHRTDCCCLDAVDRLLFHVPAGRLAQRLRQSSVFDPSRHLLPAAELR